MEEASSDPFLKASIGVVKQPLFGVDKQSVCARDCPSAGAVSSSKHFAIAVGSYRGQEPS